MNLDALTSAPGAALERLTRNETPAVDVVQAERGQTLGDIASRTGSPVEQLQAMNPQILNPDVLYPDEDVFVPLHAPGGGPDSTDHSETPPGRTIEIAPHDPVEDARKTLQDLQDNPPRREDFPNNGLGSEAYNEAGAAHDAKVAQAETDLELALLDERVSDTAATLAEAKKQVPLRSDFPANPEGDRFYEYSLTHAREKVQAAEQAHLDALLDRNMAGASASSPTSARIIEEAKAQGIPVTVLPDEQYDSEYPKTGGVTLHNDGKTEVYVRASTLADGSDTLEHELVHALLFEQELAVTDTSLPLSERTEEARNAFAELGWSPDDGERWAGALDASNGHGGQHIQTNVTTITIQREQAGLPPLTEDQRDRVYLEAARYETSKEIRAEVDATIEAGEKHINEQLALGNFDERQAMAYRSQVRDEAYATAETKWNDTDFDDRTDDAVTGATPEERQDSLRDILDHNASGAGLEEFKPPT